MDSILQTVKKMLGIDAEYKAFDTDVIVNINSALMALNQIGVGTEGFVITDDSKTWGQFIDGAENLASVQVFVYLKVKLAFDPPANSFVIDCYNRQLDELTFRLNTQVDTY